MTIWRVPVDISWPGPGSPGVNVWHVRCNSGLGADDTELQAAVDSIHTFYTDLNGPGGTGSIFAPGTRLTLAQAVEVDSSTPANPTWATVEGAPPGTALPYATQVCVSWRTQVAARRGMGRTFVGPLNHGILQTDGTIADSVLTTIRNAAAGLVGRNDSLNGWAVAIYGLQAEGPGAGGVYEGLPRVARDITAYKVRDTFAVLRSRRD